VSGVGEKVAHELHHQGFGGLLWRGADAGRFADDDGARGRRVIYEHATGELLSFSVK